MSLRTEEVCRENEAGIESTRHSPAGDIVPQRMGRDPSPEPGDLSRHVAGAVELPRRDRQERIARREQPALRSALPPPRA